MNTRSFFAVFGAWLCFAGCDHADSGESEHAHGDEAEEAEFKGCPDTIPAFELGLSTTNADSDIRASVASASHVPPQRFLNDWSVGFSHADGTPRADIRVRSARAFMPVHGHYGTPDPRVIQHTDNPAVYDLDALNLFMRGPWQVKLDVSSNDAEDTGLVFEVCVNE